VHACGVGPQVRVELLRAVVHGKRDGHGVMADAEVVVETEGHVGDFNVAHDVETNVVFDGAERGYVPGKGWCNIFMVSCVKAVVLLGAGGAVLLQQVAPRTSANAGLGGARVEEGNLAAGDVTLQRHCCHA
jgi:hypothetical protein